MKETKNTFLNNSKLSRGGMTIWCSAVAVCLIACALLLGLSGENGGFDFPVYINEVLASNTSHPNADGRCCDYIEIYNSADYPVDLTGFQLGDIAGNGRYAFPSGTTLEAGGYLVVYCDKTVEDASYAQFAISRAGGESFYLIASNNAIVDSVTTVATDSDQAMVRQDVDRWGITSLLTPGWKNGEEPASADIYNPDVSPVRITELSSVNTGYEAVSGILCDWVELHNTATQTVDISGFTLSDNVGNNKYVFPAGTVIPSGGYLVVCCAEGTMNAAVAPFGLSQYGGEAVVLKDPQGRIVEIIDTLPMENGNSMALTEKGIWNVTVQSSPGFENSQEGYEAFLEQSGAEAGAIRISEVMSAAQTVLPDRYGEFSDWVELHNTTDRAVDLAGWSLSDDPDVPDKWVFPALVIQPGERVIVFCSGRETVVDGEVHTDFSLSSGGESVVLRAYSGVTVDAVTFGEAEENCSFAIDEATGEAVLSAYPTPGYPNDESGYEAFCASAVPEGPLAIWELMSSNDWYLPQALGKCYDWVELRNISESAVNLADFSLTDDAEQPSMYALPDKTLAPGASIVIILSGDDALSDGEYAHAGFTLDAMGDQLFLFKKDGGLLDYVSFGQIPLSQSYGRTEGLGGFYYMDPTPGKDNHGGTRLISVMPTSDIAPGVYTSDTGFTVPLEAVGNIFYTLDGSDPDSSSKRYEGPIQIRNTTVLRAVSIEEGKLCSEIYTATFIIQESHNLPVVSLVSDPDNLWGRKNGIYKSGDMSIKEEKRPANVAYTGEDGSFSMDCELSLHGATTVTAFDKKSFTVRFQDNYDGPLYYDVFEDGEVTTFSSLLLRTAHESTYSTQMHDTLLSQFAADHCDTLISMKYKYVALYLNGEYWGLYAIREHHSAEHYASYMDVPAASVSMVRYCVDEQNSLKALYDFCKDNSLYYEKNYAYAESLLDMSSFADWIILQSYVGNLDINGNMRYYYSTADKLWRCGLVDVDLGMMSHSAFEEMETTFHHSRLMGSLMDNAKFQDLLASRLAELLSGPLSDESMIQRIDAMAAEIRDETKREEERWGTPVLNWELLVEDMKDFCDGRAREMINSLCSTCHLTAEEKETYFGELLQ